MLRRSWQVGLQLEVAKRLVPAAEEKKWIAEATEKLAGRQLRAEVAARRSSS